MLLDNDKKQSSFEILRLKDFRNFILGRFFLTLAIQMQMTTIGLQIYYEHGKSVFILGMIGLFEAVPFILTSLFSGHVADSVERRKIILTGIFSLLIGSGLLWFSCLGNFSFVRHYNYYALFAVVILFGVIRSFLAASVSSFMSQLVERRQYTHSATWNSTVWHIASILGPVLAAWIYGYHDLLNAKLTYLINCGLFAVAFLSFLRIGPKPLLEKIKEESIFKSLKAGIHFVFNTKMLLSAISLDLFAVLFGGAIAILPAFNDKILHAGPEAFGWLRTAPAVGAVLMAVVMTVKPPSKKAGVALIWAVIAFGLFTVAFAFCTDFWPAFIMLLLAGAFDNISVIVRHSILQLMTPENMRGRVSAVNNIFIGSSNEIGGFESGLAARLVGLVPSIVFGGCMTILVVVGVHKLNPKLKKLDLTDYQ
ncbi:MAG: MFS transporter [Bacteroidia bacterium]